MLVLHTPVCFLCMWVVRVVSAFRLQFHFAVGRGQGAGMGLRPLVTCQHLPNCASGPQDGR